MPGTRDKDTLQKGKQVRVVSDAHALRETVNPVFVTANVLLVKVNALLRHKTRPHLVYRHGLRRVWSTCRENWTRRNLGLFTALISPVNTAIPANVVPEFS
jgi:hypothetical protein